MATATQLAPRYFVRFVTTVDHPEKRGPSFAVVVEAGRRLPDERKFRKMSHAIREYEDIIRGREDFASEFVTDVQVLRETPSGSMAWARRTRYRETRGQAWQVRR